MALTYEKGLTDFVKAAEMVRQALDGYEKSLGKQHEDTKRCARNLNILLEKMGKLEDKAALEKIYPESGL